MLPGDRDPPPFPLLEDLTEPPYLGPGELQIVLGAAVGRGEMGINPGDLGPRVEHGQGAVHVLGKEAEPPHPCVHLDVDEGPSPSAGRRGLDRGDHPDVPEGQMVPLADRLDEGRAHGRGHDEDRLG